LCFGNHQFNCDSTRIVVIVIVTHRDLCNESMMADEAFALSPISARPAMPSDADYDAIREAFMETSRGRWFLNEYAKRNRNADTTMVLDAVARIEQTLAAQKQASAEAAIESLAVIRAIVGEARASVAQAIAGLDDTATLEAAQRGARVIHEVAATLRDCGADSRICDLLDQQVEAINAGHRRIAAIDRSAVDAAFDRMQQRVAETFGGSAEETAAARNPSAAAPAPAETVATEAPEPAASAVTLAEQPTAAEEQVAAEIAPAAEAGLMIVSAEVDELEFVESATETAAETAPPMAMPPAAAEDEADPQEVAEFAAALQQDDAELLLDEVVALDAETAADDAMLDLVAREMSAPDVSAPYPAGLEAEPATSPAAAAPGDEIESDIAALQQALDEEAADVPAALDEPVPAIVADVAAAADDLPPMEADADVIGIESAPAATIAATTAAPVMAATVASAEASDATGAAVAAPASLGAAALASGAIAAPPVMRSDVLVPIRRMSQAEKIAFFS
jgi:hypothetical protein